ncbi:ParA family protein (plasmid) [Vibrio scophthalmi]|uniref:ParA family protein n=1 Tax=Vibrio scophthalmi TaxID=45658 RepID=UPI003EC06133
MQLAETNLQQLEKEYAQILEFNKQETPNDTVLSLLDDTSDDQLRDFTFTSTDLAPALNITEDVAQKMRRLITKFTQDTNIEIYQDAANKRQFTHEEAEAFLSYCNHDSTRIKRIAGLPYNTPVLSITGGKGGVGKTTTAANFAVASAMDPQRLNRTLIIDRDSKQGSIGHLLSHVEDAYLFETTTPIFEKYGPLTREERLSPEVQAELREILFSGDNPFVLASEIPNLWFIPGSPDDYQVARLITKFAASANSPEEGFEHAHSMFKDLIITPLLNDFDLIVIDSSPSMDSLNDMYLYAANNLIMISTPRTLDLRAFGNFRNTLISFIKEFAPLGFTGWNNMITVLTKCPPNQAFRTRSEDFLRPLNSVLEVADDVKAYETASEKKVPLLRLKGNKKHLEIVMKQYQSIAHRIFKSAWEK